MREPAGRITVATLIACLIVSACSPDREDALPENRVAFYASYGYLDGDEWVLPMRMWVYEEPDRAREILAATAKARLMEKAGFESLDDLQEAIFLDRAHGFIADSESNEYVQFEFDNDPEQERFRIVDAEGHSGTDRNGLVTGSVVLSTDRAQQLLDAQHSTDGWLDFRVVSRNHGGAGRIRLIAAEGLSVVSDIDDTIKVTNIPAGGEEVIRKTFFEDFVAAPCMAELYGAFDDGTVFHYVSGGPWQLYGPLHGFLIDGPAGFPAGSFHMKDVRTNLTESESFEDILRLAAGGSKQATFEQKVGQIGTLLEHFPDRRFILIGDSGEKDPEVFAEIRARAPYRVADIRIRDVVDDRTRNPARLAGMSIISPEPGPGVACFDIVEEAPAADLN